MKITKESNAFGLYQKTTIEINPDELRQAIKINFQGGEVDQEKLEKEIDRAFNDFWKNFDSEEGLK
ncbi:MAG: hypothetical protein ABF723_02060 [Lentilactobacillus hilgardii]|uniref:hypothetical protein n=1 Tax=Lactobacillaceae TaxID=33958 RepID=UPI001CC22023|nr:hypothetical protein [Lentilactobacillus hilgardii]MBZ2201889.1 hypothetical protein [Lentilactobacillus hilgardii]MBZ2204565.1 hypothetical protein [Lentilactobacillus hilgardii]